MNFLARLMSHGFAIALVLLLALGFIYRGELFPEWELPEFLVFDSAKTPADNQLAGKIVPAPVQNDRVGPETAASGQDTSKLKADAPGVDDVSGAMQPADRVTGHGDSTPAEGSPAVADVVADRRSDAVAAFAEDKSGVADVVAEGKSAVADVVAEAMPAVVEAGDTFRDAGTGMPAAAITGAVVPPAREDSGSLDAPAPMETDAAPVSSDDGQTSVERAAGSTGFGDAAVALVKIHDLEEAGAPAEAAVSAVDSMGAADASPVMPDVGTGPEPVSADRATSVPYPAPAIEESIAGPAAEMPAKAANVPAGMGAAAQAPAQTGAAPATVATATGSSGSGLPQAPVTAVEDATVTDMMPAPTEPGVQGSTPAASADSTLSSYQLLALAREAYWVSDYQAAGDYYRQMILSDPDNPDGYGELANMYFSQGNWEAAASAYYEAGLRLVGSGLLAQARELVDVIRGLNGPQADALENAIKTAQADSQ